jgi:thiol-disulfide isomerase/thioredoxin
MRRFYYFIVVSLAVLIISSPGIQGQKIAYIKIPDLEKILKNNENKLFVLNFWATWCAPCVAEISGFEKAAADYDPGKVRFIMVSLDFPSQIENQLIPFLKRNKITLEIDVMMDVDYNAWIDKVDPQWQGDIPATLFFNNPKKSRYFHSGGLSEPELKKYINSLL